VKKDEKKRVELDFEVKDTGIGISKSNLPNIFNAFEQGNKFNVNFRGGAGLGLAICKNLVELLGGKISVKSKVKLGSTFTVTIPFEKPSSALQPPIKDIKYSLNADGKLLAGKKILFADDDQYILILADNILKSWQTDYLLVNNGQKVIDSLIQNKYDIVLIDIHMPEKNGMDVIKYVRSSNIGNNYNTPFIFLTATVIKADINNYMHAGFDNYLIKPFREKELYNKLCNVLRLEPLTNIFALPEQQIDDFEVNDIFDTNDLRRTANGDELFFKTTINNFLLNANNLIQMLPKEKSIAVWKDIGNKAHKAIPSFKYFRLFEIAALLEKIEDYTLRNLDYNQAEGIIDELIVQIKTAVNQAKSELKV
jgi:CheY-like chemotaxis protein